MTSGTAGRYDAIVVGGGHNGLAAGALLAKRGARALVLEARDKTGGAADTSSPWPEAPDFKVTTLSYVMSLMPDTILRELELERHGYRAIPTGPYFVPFPDGRYIIQDDDPKANHDEFAKFSKRDAEALERWEAWIGGLADVLGPLLMSTPPALGSTAPSQLNEQLRLAWRFRGLDVRGVADVTRLMTMSIVDILDRFFESDQVKTVMALNGLIGTWAGPYEPGTGYVMAHHSIGDVGDGHLGAWATPIGGMGAVSAAIESSARSFGCDIRTGASVARILTHEGRTRGVALDSGEELLAPIVVAATHPKITFLQHLDPEELPADFVDDIRNWRTKSGVVKINLALDRAPVFTAKPDFEDLTGGFELAHSVAYLEEAFEQARRGEAATRPFSDGCMPTYVDPSLAPEGKHVVSLFTQWCPAEWADEPDDAELEAYAHRVIDGYDGLAPGFKDSVLHMQVLGPHEMQTGWGLVGGNIFHGELSAEQLFHMRPAPGYADYRTPVEGLYQCSSATHGGGGVCGIPAWNCVREIVKDVKAATRRPRSRR
ncbi:MAG TPA: NAD(P)/FAD-dependent oxidoreductase [Actinomycetota bacterium]|nr:NAD(P)/FAD-dependent oxidoreductase [Actinomycetota bacterium]